MNTFIELGGETRTDWIFIINQILTIEVTKCLITLLKCRQI